MNDCFMKVNLMIDKKVVLKRQFICVYHCTMGDAFQKSGTSRVCFDLFVLEFDTKYG